MAQEGFIREEKQRNRKASASPLEFGSHSNSFPIPRLKCSPLTAWGTGFIKLSLCSALAKIIYILKPLDILGYLSLLEEGN